MIKVCDSIMGSGKTEAAIKMMNENDQPYIFITIYLEEARRIVKSCPERHFIAPRNFGKGKLDNLHALLRRRENIASTHALFSGYTEETEKLIREGGYTLIMDEAYAGFEQVPMQKVDTEILVDAKAIEVDPETKVVEWKREGDTEIFREFKDYCSEGALYQYCDTFFMWEFPVEIMKAFNDVYIMTYLFKGQILKIYFELNNIPYDYIHVERRGGDYTFADGYKPATGMGLKEKIHIFENKKINAIGDSEFALSSSWFKKNKNRASEKQLKNNIRNVFYNIWKVKYPDCLWTTIKSRMNNITPRGYAHSFLSWNIKATNEYRDRHYLAFCYNIFLNPMVKNFFNDAGKMDMSDYSADDAYALSEMIQWIWRSAIRKGDDIWIYIPSSRMRRLLKDWLDEVN